MSIMTPVIVVVAFNRINSLKRLLISLENAYYEDKVKLIISIDRGNNQDVFEYANKFIWKYGEKDVIYQEINLGLKKHILKCGDLTEKHGSIILLEDDLYVSPYFYDYAKQAIIFYKDDENISQISLYKHCINNNTFNKFSHLEDNSDNFFMQFASSWGQIWTNKQWQGFREWFKDNDLSITQKDNLPDFVINWKETSWLKYFIKYNVENNKFVVYPKISLSTNFSDLGTNVSINNKTYLYQQPLLVEKKDYKLKKINESICVYDSYYEIHKEVTEKILTGYKDIEFDLYGTKKLYKIKSKYLVSIKKCNKPIFSYSRELKPHELNILSKSEGNEISFGLTSDFNTEIKKEILKENFKYFWTHLIDYSSIFYLTKIRVKQQYINFRNKIKKKIKR
jgi:hypothetical protein